MATYCYRDAEGNLFVSSEHGLPFRRDYRAEAVGIGSGVRVSKSGTNREYAQKFLPTAADYAGPDDPDGSKGLRQWADEHQPKTGRATYPEGIPRRSY